jgi:cell division protein FtsB
MRNFQQKRIWRDVLESKPVLIILGIGILIFAWSILGFWGRMEDTARNKKIAEDKITALQEQKDKLTSQINDLNTDEGKEKVFRENYGLAKDGEEEIVVEDDQTAPLAPVPDASSGFFGFFKNLFK